MIPLAVVGAVTSGLGGLYKGITGLIGQSQYGKVKRPNFEIPQGVTDAESTLKYLAGKDMVGSAAYEQKVLANQESLLNKMENNVESGSALLGAAPSMVAKTNEGLQNIAIEGANQRNVAENNLATFQGGTKAGWQAKQWDWNKAQPYLNDMEARQKANLNTYEGGSDMLSGAFKGYTSGKMVDEQSAANKAVTDAWVSSLKTGTPANTNSLGVSSTGFNTGINTPKLDAYGKPLDNRWINVSGKWVYI